MTGNAVGKISVVVVDDHPFMRLGVITMLRSQADIDVIGEAGCYADAIAEHRNRRPDVMVVDLSLPGAGGIQLIRTWAVERSKTRFVVLTNLEGDEDIHQAFSAGAHGYVVKGMGYEILLSAVRQVARGGRVLLPSIARTLDKRTPNSDLTPREKEVLSLVAQGRSNKEIGAELGIAEPTVKRHMGAILARLEVTDRTQAVISALRRGLSHL